MDACDCYCPASRGLRGRRRQAYDLVAPIRGWFTKGFDTTDLKEAKALIETLA